VQTLVQGVLIVAAAVLVAVGGLLIVRRLVRSAVFEAENALVGSVISLLGGIYGVLLAFVVVVVWGQFTAAEQNAGQEANKAADLFRLAAGLPAPQGERVQQLLLEYTTTVIDEEWPELARGGQSARAQAQADLLWTQYTTLAVETPAATAVYAQSLERLTQFSEGRRGRVLASRDNLPPILWVLLVSGGVITVAFTYLLEFRRTAQAVWVSGALAGLITLILFFIFALDNPYRSDVRVTPEAFVAVRSYFISQLGG
jgi:hypothetical protein